MLRGMLPAEKRGFSKGLQHMAVAAFFFSLMSLLVKVLGRRLPVHEVVLVRSAVLLIITYGALRRRRIDPWGNDRKLLLLRGLLGFLGVNCLYYALIHLPLAEATVIVFTNPVFTALIAAWILAEWIGTREVGLILLSLAGVTLVAQPAALFGGIGTGLDPLGVAAGLACAIFSASAWVTVRKLGRTEPVMVIVFYFALVATVGSIPLVVINSIFPTALEWVLLLFVGITTHFGQLNLTTGLRLERAGRAASMTYLQIVFAALWGLLFFKEVPTIFSIAGAMLIVGSTFVLGRMPSEPSIQ